MPFTGDVGVGVFATQGAGQGSAERRTVLPYLYIDASRAFIHVDTYGIKTVPIGKGHLELAGRYSDEGAVIRARRGGLSEGRRDPQLIGLGTFQEFEFGAIAAYGFLDKVSGGSLVDLSYAAEWSMGKVHFYPQLGVQRRDARYAAQLYGVSVDRATATQTRSFSPGATCWLVQGLAVEWPAWDNWALVLQASFKRFDASARRSPIVNASGQLSTLMSMVRVFN